MSTATASFRLPHGGTLREAVFLRRLNRFAVEVRLDGEEPTTAHLPNTGRLRELLVEGAPVLLTPAAAPHRKTDYDLSLVRHGGLWIHVDSRLANRFLEAALEAGALAPFRGHRIERREPALDGGRLDFLLEGPGGPAWVEVKSVNLVRGGEALFPDAPTERGTRHLECLRRLAAAGREAHAVFLVQRPDAERFRPHVEEDPAFAGALARAESQGVRVHAWSLRLTPEATILANALPVRLFRDRR